MNKKERKIRDKFKLITILKPIKTFEDIPHCGNCCYYKSHRASKPLCGWWNAKIWVEVNKFEISKVAICIKWKPNKV